MSGLRNALKSALQPVLVQAYRARAALLRKRQQGPYTGYVDGLSPDGAIVGWVVKRGGDGGYLSLGLFHEDRLLDTALSNMIREDVRAATGGHAQCGFQFPVTDSLASRIAETDGKLSIRPIGDETYTIGHITLDTHTIRPAPPGETEIQAFARVMDSEMRLLLERLEEVPLPDGPLPPVEKPPFALHDRMFTTVRVIPEVPLSGQPAYLDYVRYRYRMDESYKVEPGLESADRYLYWYLTAYRGQEKRRVPLSRDLIDHLNEPLVMAGQTFTLTRAMWWRFAGRPDLMQRTNLNDRDSYLDALFWWAHQDATHLYYEDVLVPDRFADFLRGVHPSRRLDAYPLSYFTERYFNDSPRLHFLRPGTPEGRRGLGLALLLAAIQRPDLLRYVPRQIVNSLLAPKGDSKTGQSDFEDFLNAVLAVMRRDAARDTMDGDGAEDGTEDTTKDAAEDRAEDGAADSLPDRIVLPRDRYAALLRMAFFDLDSYSFLTRDRDGNRFEAAALPLPDPDRPEVDVQLIGPLAKASGLGQATRLSAEILRETGLSMRGVDFDLDNPAPEGFSSDTLIEPYGPARINLIHLNAESTPLAFAYQPDVFSGRYNIGYFFWELDKPAYCHYLGMDLLDEIWVSTDYGVEIYQPDAQGKPVVNVGMCFEEMPDIDRDDARAFVKRRFRLDDDHFVCLVAFDSFSFVQRKNPVSVLRAFQKAFEGVPNARLLVKTQNRDSVFDPVQVQLWDRVDAITGRDPRIMVMNETLSYRDLLRLKAGSDCYISLHKSEGWGFGMIEAMALGVPVVATAYSGNMDFCTDATTWLVDSEITDLQQGDYIFVRPGSQWAEPSVDHAAAQLRACFDDPARRRAMADAALAHIRTHFSRQAIAERYGDRLREILKQQGRNR